MDKENKKFFKIKVIDKEKEMVIKAPYNANLLKLLRDNDILLNANCGGLGSCGKCKVKLLMGDINKPLNDGYFLSCQYNIESDITIEIESIDSNRASDTTALDNKDSNRARDTTGVGSIEGCGFNASIDKKTIMPQAKYGLAIDIGTTTIVAYLVDLIYGKQIDIISELNAQASYGADVISRINAAHQGELNNLHRKIVLQIENIKKRLQEKHNITINKIVISANTTMLHLYKGIDPTSIGVVPFLPEFTATQYLDNDTILLPSASAYIGSDIIAGVISCGMCDNLANSVLIDIGTNGEMVLKYKDKYYCCATAAGPAFEGANITMGMGGVSGAIDHIWYSDNKLQFTTISGNAKGLCGSALNDIIAIMIDNNIIDETGSINDTLEDNPLSKHIGIDRFYITDDIYISQQDIRQYQLAKSAIRAGLETLLISQGIKCADIDTVYLAGGFGYYLDIDNAVTTGLLPDCFKNSIITSGNTSGKGAVMCLINNDYIKKCEEIALKTVIIELSNDSNFMELFIDNMSFIKEA